MTLDERLKLGEPLMTLIGSCLAAESLTAESNLKGFSELLVRRATEVQRVWDEVNEPSDGITK